MRRNKSGVSLIVLVITIIVMIILASAVMISLNNTNIFNKANEAVDKNDLAQAQNIAALAWSEAYIDSMSGTAVDFRLRIEEALTKNKIDPDKFEIDLTSNGVELVVKGGWSLVKETDATGKVTKLQVTKGDLTLDVGTTINYMPNGVGDTNYKKGWKILGVDRYGRLLILSNESVTGDSLTLGSSESIEKATDDYKNALTILQNTVSSYKDGKQGIEVRCINADDINKLTGNDPTTGSAGKIGSYNTKVTYSWDLSSSDYKPKYTFTAANGTTGSGTLSKEHTEGFYYYDFLSNKIKISKKSEGVESITTLTNTRDNYSFDRAVSELQAWNMLYWPADNAACYFLATRAVFALDRYASFGILAVEYGYFDSWGLFTSQGAPSNVNGAVRAVVTLAPNVELTDGSVAGTYDVK